MIEDKDLRDLFKIESEEHLQRLDEGLLRLEKEPGDRAVLQETFREAHSLKGAARMMGVKDVEILAHRFEDILGTARRGESSLSSETIDRLCRGLDAIRKLVWEAVAGEPSDVDLAAAIKNLGGEIPPAPFAKGETGDEIPPVSFADEKTTEPPQPPPRLKHAGTSLQGGEPEPKTEEPSPSAAGKPASAPYRIETVRVETRRLDPLMTLAGELVVAKTRTARRLAEIEEILALWEDWDREISRRRFLTGENARNRDETPINGGTDFRAPDRARFERFGTLLDRLRNEASEDSAKLDFVASEMESEIRAIRLVPLSAIFDLYPRMVRDLSREQGKEVRLTIEGGDTRADKRIVEEMKDPLMHLIRNAVDHGVETPGAREKTGKPRVGTVRLAARQSGRNVEIEVADDGKGLDAEAIKRVALRRGIRGEEELAAMSPAQIHSLIFASGFTTSSFVTEISGRGVGLDAVRAAVERLKGTIQVESFPGTGCVMRARLPVTLATARVLLTSAAGATYGFPVDFVEGMRAAARQEIFSIKNSETIVLEGRPLSVASLAALLESPGRNAKAARPEPDAPTPCVVLAAGEERLGVFVDELLGEEEVVLKPQSALLKRIRNVSGATILGTGEICTVLNPHDLIKTARSKRAPAPAGRPIEKIKPKQAVLLVEDSALTRTLEKRILEGAGYEVVVAVDGLDALNKLGSRLFDAVVSDILMPNMDGLALSGKIREDKRYNEMPVILVTSLASDEDKRRGIEAGANAYIPKPAFDQKLLLDALRRLI